ncbi:MAG: di-trans,poly-cis-decaprenylcistransferase [Rickettsiales bacterium]|jgi:undecaprenyl diphosphate synthase|nr:di-trans,poly-cis-decaprenylcistransferase [Rickettsiales bacterium]
MENYPNNIAIILDGNGRWAQKRGLPISLGHKRGAEVLENIVRYCGKIGLRSLTIFIFSTENWKRPVEEVNYLMDLFNNYIDRFLAEKESSNIRTKFIGNFDKLEPKLLDGIRKIEEKTKSNTGLKFDIALSYGGRLEVVDACKKFAKDFKDGKIMLDDLKEDTFKNYLYDSEINYPDLVIRTGGNYRLSNFLLWELSYSELYFTDTLWPDFDENSLMQAIENFQQRKRTFGEREAKR